MQGAKGFLCVSPSGVVSLDAAGECESKLCHGRNKRSSVVVPRWWVQVLGTDQEVEQCRPRDEDRLGGISYLWSLVLRTVADGDLESEVKGRSSTASHDPSMITDPAPHCRTVCPSALTA